jgi:hypothetical protein
MNKYKLYVRKMNYPLILCSQIRKKILFPFSVQGLGMNPQALAFLQQQMLGQYALMNGLVAPSSSSAAEPMARTTSKVVLAPPTPQPAHDQVINFIFSRGSSFD